MINKTWCVYIIYFTLKDYLLKDAFYSIQGCGIVHPPLYLLTSNSWFPIGR